MTVPTNDAIMTITSSFKGGAKHTIDKHHRSNYKERKNKDACFEGILFDEIHC